MRVGVVTDSTCDLPAATLRRVRVEAVPLRLEVGEESYLDWRDIDPATLYDWIQNQGVLPTVHSPEPEDFMHVYRRTFQRYESLVSIHLSANFSNTLGKAHVAARKLGIEDRVTFIDSGFVGAGLAEIVLEAARLARAGESAVAVREVAQRLRRQLYGVISPTSASWNAPGGRWGELLQRGHRGLKHRPLVAVSDGRLEQLGWASRTRVAEAMARELHERFGDQPLRLAVAYGGSDQAQLAGLRLAMERAGLTIAHGRVQLIGPALGARFGAGAASVFARPSTEAED
jgi:DegV family protein with EDD domain